MNSALSVLRSAVGRRDSRPPLQCVVTVDMASTLRACGPEHRPGKTRRSRPLRRAGNLQRVAENPYGNVTQNCSCTMPMVDDKSRLMNAGSDTGVAAQPPARHQPSRPQR
jgi:hypothetical protein